MLAAMLHGVAILVKRILNPGFLDPIGQDPKGFFP